MYCGIPSLSTDDYFHAFWCSGYVDEETESDFSPSYLLACLSVFSLSLLIGCYHPLLWKMNKKTSLCLFAPPELFSGDSGFCSPVLIQCTFRSGSSLHPSLLSAPMLSTLSPSKPVIALWEKQSAAWASANLLSADLQKFFHHEKQHRTSSVFTMWVTSLRCLLYQTPDGPGLPSFPHCQCRHPGEKEGFLFPFLWLPGSDCSSTPSICILSLLLHLVVRVPRRWVQVLHPGFQSRPFALWLTGRN